MLFSPHSRLEMSSIFLPTQIKMCFIPRIIKILFVYDSTGLKKKMIPYHSLRCPTSHLQIPTIVTLTYSLFCVHNYMVNDLFVPSNHILISVK